MQGCPSHIAAVPRSFRFLLPFFRARVSPGFSVGQLIILSIYFSILCFATFFQSTGPFTDFHRLGWVATAQIPLVFAFGVKNGVVASLLGKGYEKVCRLTNFLPWSDLIRSQLNYIHRFLGRIIVLGINLHALGYIYKWCQLSIFREKIADPHYTWGLVGLIAMDGLFFLSTQYMRKYFYRLFVFSHICCVLVLFPAVSVLHSCRCIESQLHQVWYHKPALIPWIGACIAIYVFDHLLRMVRTRLTIATLSPLSNLEVTRLECLDLNAGWRAGQHVRVRVLSMGMGILGCTEVHPFTIASSADGQGLVLYCKKAGPWTRKLFKIASERRQLESGGADVRVLIEGPYSGPGHLIFSSFTAALFVAGGSGISFALGAIEELIYKASKCESRVQLIDLVWMIQDACGFFSTQRSLRMLMNLVTASLNPLLPQFAAMISRCPIPLRISVHYTRTGVVGKVVPTQYFPPNVALNAGRADIVEHLESLAVEARTKEAASSSSGLIVGVCGPTGLGDSVAQDVGAMDTTLRDQIGGVELYEE
jgi:predicted ferric reductase